MTAARALSPWPVRFGRPDDLAYVVNTWVHNAPALRLMRTGEATRHVRALLSRDGAQLRVAYVPHEADAIMGWAALEEGRPWCVHYVYVRDGARRQGVARALLEDWLREAVDFSHPAPRYWPRTQGKPPEPFVVPRMWNLNEGRTRT